MTIEDQNNKDMEILSEISDDGFLNTYHKELVKRGARIFRTDIDGKIILHTDESLEFKKDLLKNPRLLP